MITLLTTEHAFVLLSCLGVLMLGGIAQGLEAVARAIKDLAKATRELDREL